MESPPSEKHPWPTATLKSRSLADTKPPHLSLHFRDLILQVHFLYTTVALSRFMLIFPFVLSSRKRKSRH